MIYMAEVAFQGYLSYPQQKLQPVFWHFPSVISWVGSYEGQAPKFHCRLLQSNE